jgi:hypothetical protein
MRFLSFFAVKYLKCISPGMKCSRHVCGGSGTERREFRKTVGSLFMSCIHGWIVCSAAGQSHTGTMDTVWESFKTGK